MPASAVAHGVSKRSWEAIGMAFSGGGFRATLFHLGTICSLKKAGLLGKVRFITSVSGGSIAAAHLVQNWDRYIGSDTNFAEAASELIEFVRRDVRGRVLRRWLLSWLLIPLRLSPRTLLSRLLQSEYDSLYRKGSLKDLNPASGARPELHLLTTSLTTGDLCSFDFRGFRHRSSRDSKENLIKNPELRISLAVAASSAFPPLFPPLVVTREELNAPDMQFAHALSDGGVFDNLGLQRINDLLAKSEKNFDTAVVSDAEGPWAWKTDRKFSFVLGRNVRASDLLMKRVSALEYSLLGMYSQPAKFEIGSELDSFSEGAPVLGEDVQHQVPKIRTDLDTFSSDEINALLRHGYTVARAVLKSDGVWKAVDEELWSFLNPSSTLKAGDIRERSTQGWIARVCSLWTWHDWTSYAIPLMLLFYVSAALLPYVRAVQLRNSALAQSSDIARTAESLKSKVALTQDTAKDFTRLNQIIHPDQTNAGRDVATVQIDRQAPLPSGHTALYDGFRNYLLSTFDFQTGTIVPWGTRKADIGVANPSGTSSDASFFLNSDTPPYSPLEKDRQGITAMAGIVKMEADNLTQIRSAPEVGYAPNYFPATRGSTYCVRTWDGQHFAKLLVTEVGNDHISFDWVYQPSGSHNF